MQAQHLVVAMACMEQAVFDHAGGRSHQRKGVRVLPPVVAGDVDHAAQPALRGQHRRSGASEEAVACQVVFGAVDDDGAFFGQGRADGVGAAVVFVPERAGPQRDAFGTGGEIDVAQGVEQQAVVVGQHHDVAAVTDLVEHEAHDRTSVGQQVVLAGQGMAQVGGCAQWGFTGHIDRAEARMAAAQPGLPQGVVHQPWGHVASVHQAAAGLQEVRF